MKKQTRRQVIQTLGLVAAAPAFLGAQPKTKRYRIGFSTLGCPKWEWKTILKNASDLGFMAIELRGIQGDMDLTKRPEFNGERLKESLKDLAALDIRISDLGASAHMHESDPAKRAAQLGEAKRFIELAQRLKAPCVRVFGDKLVQGEPKQATVDRIIAGLRELGQFSKGSGVKVLMETHGDFPDSATVLQIMKGVAMPEVGLLWDAHHTCDVGKEKPADTFKAIGSYVHHVHLKDSIPAAGADGIRYVMTGTGKIPVRETVRVLVKGGYRGYYNFEWEKTWIPDLEEPEIAFPQYAKTMSQYLADAGVKPA
jgi:sugar phosphate isomerase/epimerase